MTILLSIFSKKACATLASGFWDEELCRVYHENFFACYTQRADGHRTFQPCTFATVHIGSWSHRVRSRGSDRAFLNDDQAAD